jgi:hypothetical protein
VFVRLHRQSAVDERHTTPLDNCRYIFVRRDTHQVGPPGMFCHAHDARRCSAH